MKTVHVAVGVVLDGDKVFVCKRAADAHQGNLWEFPGGKIEPGESLEECVHREIREELGIEIAVNDRLITIEHAYTHFKVTLNVFNCTYLSGTPQPIECDEVKWVTLEDIDSYPFPKANSQIIDALRAQAQRQ